MEHLPILPWQPKELRELALSLVRNGEATKVDAKRQLNIGSAAFNAELSKDISAMANTYAYPHHNHAFIILGATGCSLSYTQFNSDEDKLQAQIDQIINGNIEPFIPTHLRIFDENGMKWGLIVVPPTRTAPHVFSKDIDKCCKGDIYVRRGTTTAKAVSADYIRFFRLHLDEHTYELRQRLDNMERTIQGLRSEGHVQFRQTVNNTELSQPAVPAPGPEHSSPTRASVEPDRFVIPAASQEITSLIEATFAKQEDPIRKGLVDEARKVQLFLKGDEIPWGINQLDKAKGKEVLDRIENAAGPLWDSLGTLMIRDELGKYCPTILDVFEILAEVPEPPSGMTYTDWGTGIRYLVIVVSLYIVFVTGVASRRFGLLKDLAMINLRGRQRHDDWKTIPYALFFVRGAEQVLQTQFPGFPQQGWSDPVGSYIEILLQSR